MAVNIVIIATTTTSIYCILIERRAAEIFEYVLSLKAVLEPLYAFANDTVI